MAKSEAQIKSEQRARKAGGGKVSHSDEIAWVAKQLTVDKASPSAVISPGALNLLLWAKGNPANERTFWATIWPKLVSKEKQEERKDAQKDDQRTIFRIFEALERERPKFYRPPRPTEVGSAEAPAVKPAASASCQAEVSA